MPKVAPVDDGPAEVGVAIEAPPPGWKDDPEAGSPVLEESANDEFLAASRKRREEALAKRGTRRYNIAIRIAGVVVILNMLVCCLPLVDGSYQLAWSTFKVATGSIYSINHFAMVDPKATGESLGAAPLDHLQVYDPRAKIVRGERVHSPCRQRP
jgi:hypothetical protein